MTKYMNDYNYHDWAKFIVVKPEQKPAKPHFAAVLFDCHMEHSGYQDDASYSVPHIVYFAFPDQETLKEWILRATKEKKQFFFFEVKKLGTAELKIDVDLET